MSYLGKNMYAKAELPFAGFSRDELGMVEKVIRTAWNYLKKHQDSAGIVLITAHEAPINILLVQTINALRNADESKVLSGFKGQFDRLSSSAEYKNFKGNGIKQPDMVFHRRVSAHPGVEDDYQSYCVEAKRLTNAPGSLHDYNENGVERFLAGDYAWAMPIGMMLGYCQSGLELPEGLSNNLQKNKNKKRYQIAEMPKRSPAPNPAPAIYRTVHTRSWSYSDREGKPGDIEIRHLWLNCF